MKRVVGLWPLRVALFAAGLFVFVCGGAGCGRHVAPEPDAELAWTLSPSAPSVGPATLTVTVRTRAGAPVTGARVRLEAHMSHPGMTPVLADATERTPGIHEIAFAFTMPGDWVLLASAVLPGGARIEQRIDVANVRPAG